MWLIETGYYIYWNERVHIWLIEIRCYIYWKNWVPIWLLETEYYNYRKNRVPIWLLETEYYIYWNERLHKLKLEPVFTIKGKISFVKTIISIGKLISVWVISMRWLLLDLFFKSDWYKKRRQPFQWMAISFSILLMIWHVGQAEAFNDNIFIHF